MRALVLGLTALALLGAAGDAAALFACTCDPVAPNVVDPALQAVFDHVRTAEAQSNAGLTALLSRTTEVAADTNRIVEDAARLFTDRLKASNKAFGCGLESALETTMAGGSYAVDSAIAVFQGSTAADPGPFAVAEAPEAQASLSACTNILIAG